MRIAQIETSKRSHLYAQSMCLEDVTPGVRFVRYNVQLRLLFGDNGIVDTFTGAPYLRRIDCTGDFRWAAPTAHCPGTDFLVCWLADNGIADYNNGHRNQANFSVRVDEKHMVEFHRWLLQRGDAKSATKLVKALPLWLPAQAPRNPMAPEFAMTADDLQSMTQLISLYRGHGITPSLRFDTLKCGLTVDRWTSTEHPNNGYFVAADGISEWPPMVGTGWSQSFSVVDIAENRVKLLNWLLSQGGKYDRAAQQLLDKYPELKRQVRVENGMLVVTS